MKIYTRLLAAALLLALAAPAAADPITVTATDRVTLTFGTNPGNWDAGDPPDYLDFQLHVFAEHWLGAQHPVTVSLYDGDRLIHTRTGRGTGGQFQGAGMEVRRDYQSAWDWPVIDFTSLLDGSIDGRLEVSPTAGAFMLDLAKLDLRSWSPDYIGPHPLMLMDVRPEEAFWIARGDFDWIRNPQISVAPMAGTTPVPEPGTLSLLAAGLGAGWLQRRRRARRIGA